MSIRNCPECGRIFEFYFRNLCPECIKTEENESQAIVNYLRASPGVGIPEISEATGISVDKIVRMLKSGRLIAVFEKNGINLITCERCGRPISTGNFCQSCRDSMAKVLSEGGKASGKHTVENNDTGHGARKETGKSDLFTSHFKK